MAAQSPPNDPNTDPSIPDLIAARPWLKHDAMDGLLLDDVSLAGIADAVGTPTWVYSAATLRAKSSACSRDLKKPRSGVWTSRPAVRTVFW